MKNTHRQDACCTNHPPSTGPMAAVIEVKPDQVPIARPRSSLENETLIRAGCLAREAPHRCLENIGRRSLPMLARGRTRPTRRKRECTEGEDLTPAVEVAKRSAREQQGGEEERVRFDYPLNVGNGRVHPDCSAGSAT